MFMLVRLVGVSECCTARIYVFYLYERDGVPTCIAFTDPPVKRPEDDLYVGRNM